MFWTSQNQSTRKTKSSNDYYNTKSSGINSWNSNQSYNSNLRYTNNEQDMSQKIQKFIKINNGHDFDEVCVCEDCIYAKQLNRYQLMKLDLSKGSSYRAQYNKNLLKKNLNNTVDLTSSTVSKKTNQESSIGKSKYLQIGSMYNNQYASRSMQKVQKPKPTDELKFNGPLVNFSSSKSVHKSVNPPSQYMQPIKIELLPSLKLIPGSIYSDSYKNQKVVKTQTGKMQDQLKLGKDSLVKQSTSKSIYNSPNPQTYTQIPKTERFVVQKRIQTPNFSYQYNTINRNEFQKPVEKKNCRNRRMQVLYGQMLASQLSTIF